MKKVLSFALALLILFSSINVYAFVDTNQYLDENDKKAEAIYENDKVKSLILQGKGKLKDEDSKTFMVELDPSYFSDIGSIVPARNLYTDQGLKTQIDFGNRVNAKALKEIEALDIDLKVLNKFNILMLGFSAEMTFEDAKKLAALDFIEKIIIQNEIAKPIISTNEAKNNAFRMATSRDLIGNQSVYSKYKGQGKIVAVIDSGFDPSHEAFYLTEEGRKEARYSEADINKLKEEGILDKGFYISEKVPFAYNYFPETNPEKIKQSSEKSHGQHVAGTVAANHVKVNLGEKEIDLAGVAPEAQLALMRVFSDEIPGTSPDIYVLALEDCVKLRVDAVNMSLGAAAGDATEIFPDAEKLFGRLEEAGCVVAVAAGNETAFGANAGFKPRADYPDYGILGDPAAAEKSMAVASIENGYTVQQYFKYKDSDGKFTDEFLDWSRNEKNKIVEPDYDKEFDLVYLGLGKEEDYANKDVNGKVALIERGENTFEDKVIRAKAKGAKAVLIYNHQEGGDEFIGMAGAGNHEIAVGGLYYSTGMKLRENAKTVIFKKGRMSFYNPLAGQISKFSSFGLTADGSFKPDITAPGGNIYSLGNNNTYNSQNGTSMATPHVAGGLALVSSMVDDKYPDLQGQERYQRIRNLLMSTAEVHYFNKAATSPRRQGAGVMKLQNALNTKAILIGDKNETKLFNKNASNVENLTFKIQNLSDEAISYNYKTTIVADEVKNSYFTYNTRWLKDVNQGRVDLGPRETKEITVKIDTSEFASDLKAQMPNGYFIDGFVIFENPDEPTISIPFITFVGDLDRVQVVESPVYDLVSAGKIPFYWNEEGNVHMADRSKEEEIGNNDFTHLFTAIGEQTEILGQHKDFTNQDPKFYDKHVISPNKDGYADNFYVKYTMIRSGNVSINIYKADENGNKVGNPLANLLEDEMTVKNYGSMLLANSYYVDIPYPSSSENLEDGNYVLAISSYRNKDKVLDDVEMTFVVDTKKPTIENFKIQDNILTFDAKDENGIRDEFVKINDTVIEKIEAGYLIPEGTDLKDIVVEVRDLGYNSFKTTADIEVNDNKSRINIITILNKEDPDFSLKYKIFDENGREFYADNLAPGNYRLEILKPEEIYEIKEIDGISIDQIKEENGKYIYEFTLGSDTKDLEIKVEKLDAHYVFYWVYDYTKDFKGVSLINQETQAKIDLNLEVGQNSDNYVGAKAFSKVIPYGTYEAVFDADEENYEFKIYREFDKGNGVNDKEEADRTLVVEENSKLNSAGNISLSIVPEKKNYTVNVYGDGLENSSFKIGQNALDFDRSKGTQIKYISKNLPINHMENTELEPDDYLFAAIPDEGYYAEPALYLMELKSSRITSFPSQAEYTLADRNVNLQMDIKKSQGTGSLVINDNIDNKQAYLVQDIRGYFGLNNKVYTDLDKLPEGNYIISTVIDENTEAVSPTTNQLVKITAGESTQVDFSFEPIDFEGEGALVVESLEKVKVQIRNLKTGELVDPLMDYEEDGKYGYMFMGIQGVYELVINDGMDPAYPTKTFVMTEDTYLTVNKEENPIVPPVEDDSELKEVLAELEALKAQAKAIDEDKYTEKSLRTLKECLDKIADTYTDLEEAKKALETLKAAFNALEEKPAEPEKPVEPDKPVEPEKPTEPERPIEPQRPIFDPYWPGLSLGSIFFNPADESIIRKSEGREDAYQAEKKDYGIELGRKFEPMHFDDISLAQKDVVDFVSSHKIMLGIDVNKFGPNAPITRAMLAETLRRISKDKTFEETTKFKDLEKDAWYTEAVYWAASHKYVIGDDQGNFNPNAKLSRQEFALILNRFLEENDIDPEKTKEFNYEDEDQIPFWSKDAVKNMAERSIVEGAEKEFYKVRSNVSRYELARALKLIVEWAENN